MIITELNTPLTLASNTTSDCFETIEGVKFLPWIGSGYWNGFNGLKILVLGESHYCASEDDAVCTITRDVIRDLMDPSSPHEYYKNTYTKFVGAMVGHRGPTYEEKSFVWNNVAFYNFVQFPMTGPRRAPSSEEFQLSDDAFFKVLSVLRPDLIFVWGKRLYNHLPNFGSQGKDILAPNGKWIETWQYESPDGGVVKIIPIRHPSSGFSPVFWHNVMFSHQL